MYSHPIEEVIEPFIQKFRDVGGYFVEDDRALNFFKTHPKNDDRTDVLLKIGEVRDQELMESLAQEAMVQHIISLKPNQKLAQADLEIVNNIASLRYLGKDRMFYAFATRYCNYHYPEVYPIYDQMIKKILSLYYHRIHQIELKHDELMDYPKFKSLMEQFKASFHLSVINYRELDKFLWVYGREVMVKFRKLNGISENPEKDADLRW